MSFTATRKPVSRALAAAARRLRERGVPGVSLLHSGLSLDGLGAYGFLAARPLATAVAEPGQPLRVLHGPPGLERGLSDDPLRAAAQVLERLHPPTPADPRGFPFAGGGVLALSYDLGRRYERLPARAAADHRAPDLFLAVYGRVLALDVAAERVELLGDPALGGLTPADVEDALSGEGGGPALLPGDPPAPAVTLSADAYVAAVERARELIRRGDLFEVNLSRRYTATGVDPDAVFASLLSHAPAPFMADLELGAGRRLLSASPERFLRLGPDGRVSSWPIKGTRPRDPDPERDAALAAELLASEKEAAELAMIVDLVRNDLGRVARPGSVVVAEPRGLQSWPTVHHTVGVVEAELEAGRAWDDLVRASFPPGSVTGAPKIRAMEVIDELEPVRRGLYCGSFGWVGWDGALDLAVAIRIVAVEGERAHAHAGGAVLLDSDPAAEEAESATKARALLRALGEARRG